MLLVEHGLSSISTFQTMRKSCHEVHRLVQTDTMLDCANLVIILTKILLC